MAGQVDSDRTVPEKAEFGLERREGKGVREGSMNQYERRLHLSPHSLASCICDARAEEQAVVLHRLPLRYL
ncbi:hypothetical protein ABT186_16840 [Streptomyces sp. NPDC001634]|uniref:hypothetical protein n=1 Tax=Streptomyces sp. NPDC001634 TaxID=3154390 RepID=UPI00332118E0